MQSHSFDSYYDFEKWHKNNPNILFLENECDQSFMCITLNGVAEMYTLKLSFPYENDIEKIKIFIDSNGNNLIIYTDGNVYFISIKDKELVYTHKLNDPVLNVFYELDNFVILIGEVSVSVFCNSSIVWKKQTDIITNFSINGYFLYLDFLDSHSLKIDIITGTIIDN